MPVGGIVNDVRRGWRVLGRVKKGAPKGQGLHNRNYFRLDTNDEDLLHAWADVYGAEPRSLDVTLPYDLLRDNWDQWLELWGAGGTLKVRCNGTDWVQWRDSQGVLHNDPRPCPWCSGERANDPNQHQLVGRLFVMSPPLLERGFSGVLMLVTGSWNDCRNIERTLRTVDDIVDGELGGVPMVLSRSCEKITMTRDGKRVRRDDWLVRLDPNAQWLQRRMELQRLRAIESRPRATAAAGVAPTGADSSDDQIPFDEPPVAEDDWDGPNGPYDEPPPDDDEGEPISTGPTDAQQARDNAPPASTRGRGNPLYKGDTSPPSPGVRSPETVQKELKAQAWDLDHKGVVLSGQQRGAMVGALNTLFQTEGASAERIAQGRHLVQDYVFGKPKSEDLTPGEVLSLLWWAQTRTDDGGYAPSPQAMKEAQVIEKEALAAGGQDEIPW